MTMQTYTYLLDDGSKGRINYDDDRINMFRGAKDDCTIVEKFGAVSGVGTTLTPICSSGFYRTPTAATALEIVSASANDTAAGTGARSVFIQGLQAWDDPILTEVEIATNGTTAVAAGSWYRVFRMYVGDSGTYASQSAASSAGNITLREVSGGAAWSLMSSLNSFQLSQSLIGAYSVPSGYDAYVDGIYYDIESSKAVNLVLFQRQRANVVSAPYGALRSARIWQNVTGSRNVLLPYPIGSFTGPCDIGFMGAATPSGTANISVGFDILMFRSQAGA